MDQNVSEEKELDVSQSVPAKKNTVKKVIAVIKWTAGVILLVLLGVFICRDSIVKFATCKVGSFLTGTKVELKDFSTSLSGKVRLSGFSVGNPQGFSPANSIEFKEIFVHIDIPSLLSDTIRIHRISVTGMGVNLETDFNTTNLNAIQANVENISNSGKAEDPQSGETVDKKEGKQKAVYIAKLDTQASSLAFTSSTVNQTLNIPLPPVHMTDIGGKSIADTVDELFGVLINSVSSAVSNIGGAVASAVTDAGNQIGKGVSETGKGLTKGTKKLGRDLEKTGKDLIKSLNFK